MTQGHTNKVGVSDVESLKNNRAWQAIVKDMLDVRAAIQEQVNMLGKDAEVKYSERDINIIKMQLIEELIQLPDKYLDWLQDKSSETFDPYGSDLL